ncbi:MAG: hypothetical protein EHM91_11170 [Planctomycetota bacterium]|nr:MAG: hypothetical protein EHM91_11170 [Planctomycetota bacterium]
MDKAKRVRQLYIVSIVLFVLFCAIPGLRPLVEGNRPEFSVTGLASQLAGIFAWALMCSAYQMRGKLNGAEPTKG